MSTIHQEQPPLSTESRYKRGDVVALNSPFGFPFTVVRVSPCFVCDQGGDNAQHDGYMVECTWTGPSGQPFENTFHEACLRPFVQASEGTPSSQG